MEQPVIVWAAVNRTLGHDLLHRGPLPRLAGQPLHRRDADGGIPGTGHLERIVLNKDGEELRRESLLAELKQRIRDVRQGPDGLLYVLTDAAAGGLLRIEPVRPH